MGQGTSAIRHALPLFTKYPRRSGKGNCVSEKTPFSVSRENTAPPRSGRYKAAGEGSPIAGHYVPYVES